MLNKGIRLQHFGQKLRRVPALLAAGPKQQSVRNTMKGMQIIPCRVA
jgi:hypothetical protein